MPLFRDTRPKWSFAGNIYYDYEAAEAAQLAYKKKNPNQITPLIIQEPPDEISNAIGPAIDKSNRPTEFYTLGEAALKVDPHLDNISKSIWHDSATASIKANHPLPLDLRLTEDHPQYKEITDHAFKDGMATMAQAFKFVVADFMKTTTSEQLGDALLKYLDEQGKPSPMKTKIRPEEPNIGPTQGHIAVNLQDFIGQPNTTLTRQTIEDVLNQMMSTKPVQTVQLKSLIELNAFFNDKPPAELYQAIEAGSFVVIDPTSLKADIKSQYYDYTYATVSLQDFYPINRIAKQDPCNANRYNVTIQSETTDQSLVFEQDRQGFEHRTSSMIEDIELPFKPNNNLIIWADGVNVRFELLGNRIIIKES